MSHRLGNAQPCVPDGAPCGECAALGMARASAAREARRAGDPHRRAHVGAPPRAPRASAQAIDGPTIVTLVLVGDTEILLRQRMQDHVAVGRGHRRGALGGGWPRSYAPSSKLDGR